MYIFRGSTTVKKCGMYAAAMMNIVTEQLDIDVVAKRSYKSKNAHDLNSNSNSNSNSNHSNQRAWLKLDAATKKFQQRKSLIHLLHKMPYFDGNI